MKTLTAVIIVMSIGILAFVQQAEAGALMTGSNWTQIQNFMGMKFSSQFTTLQGAVNGGGVIVIDTSYSGQSQINIPSDTEIYGLPGIVVNFSGVGFVNSNPNTLNGNVNIKIHDLNIVGTPLIGSNNGIHLRNVSNSQIYNVNVSSFSHDGVILEDAVNSSIKDSYSFNNGDCTGATNIELYNVQNSTVDNNWVWGQGTTVVCSLGLGTRGISLSYKGSNIVSNNHVLSATDNGIMNYLSNNNILKGNQIKNYAIQGIEVQGSSNNTVESNNIQYGNVSLSHGIYLLGDIGVSQDNKVISNTITNTYIGITLDASNFNIVSGNIVNHNVYGIAPTDGASFNTISGNTVTSNTQDGINLGSSTTFNVVSGGNIIRNNGGNGVYSNSAGAANNIIDGNIVYGNGVEFATSPKDIQRNNIQSSPMDFGNNGSSPSNDAPYHVGPGDKFFNTTSNLQQIYTTVWEWFITSTIGANNIKDRTIKFSINNGSNVFATGVKPDGDVEMPCTGTIIQATAMADQTGSSNISWWVDSYANYPPTAADSLGYQVITTSTNSQSGVLSQAVTAGQIMRFNVESVDTITKESLNLQLRCS